MLSDAVPDGMKFLAASDGGQHDAAGRQVSWRLGEIAPGKSKDVRLELAPTLPGDHHQRIIVQAARGERAETEIRTRAEGVAALVAEVADTDDPIEVGAETTYEVRVLNAGTKEDAGVKLICTVPDKMELVAVQAPCRYGMEGKNVIFEPLSRLQPRGDALYRITVRGMAPGDARFKVQISSSSLIEPLLRTESSRVYSDAAP
jgi:hypothetical protein